MAAVLLLLAGCIAGPDDYLLGWESVPCSIEPPEDQPDNTAATEFPVEGDPRPSLTWVRYSTADEWRQGGAAWDVERGTIMLWGGLGDPLTDCLLWLAE